MMAGATQLEELVRRVQFGDDEAFTRLVELCTPRVYNLVYRMAGSGDDAQDIAQEAFLRIYQALPRFKGESSFSTWLYRIVANVCFDELKRRRRRAVPLTDLQPDPDSPSVLESVRAGEDVEEALVKRERQRAIQEAILELPEHFRLALVLYDIQGLSYQEIADILKTNVGTVKSRLNRARNLLREKLSQNRELFGFTGSRNR